MAPRPVAADPLKVGLPFSDAERGALIEQLTHHDVSPSPLILATVGTQFPFDRMLRAVDRWALDHRAARIVAQTHDTDAEFGALRCRPFLDARAVDRLARRADLIVAHAGMGSLITALESRTPIIVMPRSAMLGEHRNEHQRGSARVIDQQGLAHVAADEDALYEKLSDPATWTPRFVGTTEGLSIEHPLVSGIASFIADVPPGRRKKRLPKFWRSRPPESVLPVCSRPVQKVR
ncbi:MAG: glycosyltransferase [Planctomycetota bacterium]